MKLVHLFRDMFTLGRTGELLLRLPISKGLCILLYTTGRIVFAPKKVSLFHPLAKFPTIPMWHLLFLRFAVGKYLVGRTPVELPMTT